jgi:hypothetical protein
LSYSFCHSCIVQVGHLLWNNTEVQPLAHAVCYSQMIVCSERFISQAFRESLLLFSCNLVREFL